MSAENDITTLDATIEDLRLRRYRIELAGDDWESEEWRSLTWRITDLMVERGRILADQDRAEVLARAHLERYLEKVGE